MSQLGFFTGYDIRGSDVLFCAHHWVGLALDQDNAMRVTILHGVHPADASVENVEAIATCGDMYDFSLVTTDGNGHEAKFELPDRKITFRSNAISHGARYYTQGEIDLLLDRLFLDQDVSDESRTCYLVGLEARKHLIVRDRFEISVAIELG
jgi:hypothetical protein